jgi:hypothetical protein
MATRIRVGRSEKRYSIPSRSNIFSTYSDRPNWLQTPLSVLWIGCCRPCSRGLTQYGSAIVSSLFFHVHSYHGALVKHRRNLTFAPHNIKIGGHVSLSVCEISTRTLKFGFTFETGESHWQLHSTSISDTTTMRASAPIWDLLAQTRFRQNFMKNEMHGLLCTCSHVISFMSFGTQFLQGRTVVVFPH